MTSSNRFRSLYNIASPRALPSWASNDGIVVGRGCFIQDIAFIFRDKTHTNIVGLIVDPGEGFDLAAQKFDFCLPLGIAFVLTGELCLEDSISLASSDSLSIKPKPCGFAQAVGAM